MSTSSRIYLDNAATSWPKPEAVYAAVDEYQRNSGAAAGRGAYGEAIAAGESVASARRAVARLIEAESAQQIVFTSNGTDSLNLAIHGALGCGGHVVTTVAEHNSVLRPLRWLESAGRIEVTRVGCRRDGVVEPADIRAALRPETRLVVLTHASNVTGALQPAAEVAELAHERGALLLLDAAQTLGDLPLSVRDLPVDLLAAPGHKGLLGPLGTGVLYLRPGVEQQIESIRQGGTGSVSDEDSQPDFLPDKFESGNLNLPGIVGLAAGVKYLYLRDVRDVRRHAEELTARLLDGLAGLTGVTLYGPATAAERVGVVSINLQGYDPQEVAATLDAAFHIQVRSGVQCAPLMHRELKTLPIGGVVRFSVGPFTTTDDIDAAISALRDISTAMLAV
jgi:cysteine desulfurase/selenocysteine lyase